jgi:hypothetical protein
VPGSIVYGAAAGVGVIPGGTGGAGGAGGQVGTGGSGGTAGTAGTANTVPTTNGDLTFVGMSSMLNNAEEVVVDTGDDDWAADEATADNDNTTFKKVSW